MTLIVFSGPTIPPEAVAGQLDAICLPPVAQGDVYRAMALKPRAIGIIDGFFQGVPAVWHKEILWALSHGVAVYGSASMGALRAAELHTMGMRGVGQIFDDYRRGVLEDDDEVAVVHGPAEMGYLALGEAMVNVRATLRRAVQEGILAPAIADEFCERAKKIFYQHRTWERLVAGAGDLLGDSDGFAGWLETGRVDQKRLDADAMLVAMKQDDEAGMETAATGFDFETTLVWQRLVADCAQVAADGDRRILDEVALQPERYAVLRQQAEVRALALFAKDAPASSMVEPSEVQNALTRFREDRGLYTQAAFTDWLSDSDLELDVLKQHVADDVVTQRVLEDAAGAINQQIIAVLQLSGDYQKFCQRAQDKARVLAEAGLEAAELDQTGLMPVQLANWYFQERLECEMPENLSRYAFAHGFSDLDQFINCLAREYFYLTSRVDR